MTEEDKQQSPLTAYKLSQLEKEVDEMRNEIKQMREEAHEKEKHLMTVGLITLGTVVTTLGGIIWNFRQVIFK